MKDSVGQIERLTQNRVVRFFQDTLDYRYLGDWHERENNRNIESEILTDWLKQQTVDEALIPRALRELHRASALGEGKHLYDANRAVYELLKYGIKVSAGAGENKTTVHLIDWANPLNNDFAIAEEVSVKGENKKRPDIVLYVNGIALGVLELKRSSVSVSEGIQQNLSNQNKNFIRNFFTTMQLVLAGNDSEGLRYGTILTPEKHFYQWKQDDRFADGVNERNRLDNDLAILCDKTRLLEIVHDFIVFDAGFKKLPRHNQYYGVRAAQTFVERKEGGIIWHTQGSGKSLTMVWLAKWLRSNREDARVLVITDRRELDEQIEQVFTGVDEQIVRTKSGSDLIDKLNQTTSWLLCSLVHKFGGKGEVSDAELTEKDAKQYIEDLRNSLPGNFKAKGNLVVFVDECHRTQSGSLHEAMTSLLPDALFIGFTGTPLLKADKARSIEVFGRYIHTYKFDEAVKDGVVLDLRYEARDIDQYVGNQKKIDQWFEAKTNGLTDYAVMQIKKRWGTMRSLFSSEARLGRIVQDVLFDMETKERLSSGRGNAMLVCDSVFQACKVYEMFQSTPLAGKCAIVTSYKPSPGDISKEETGEGLTEKLRKYDIYRGMLSNYFEVAEDQAMYKVDDFETQVKKRFKDEPAQMRLLIVVDKLLTGFDAPSATYLYIDKKMQDHGLFQAICRVNRLDGDDKAYGYIVDYKDLFKSLEGAVADYTHGALDGFDKNDIEGLLTDRVEKGREKLDDALEAVRALCEPVMQPRDDAAYIRYFCGDPQSADDLRNNETKRIKLYKLAAALGRAYLDMADEMDKAGYSSAETESIKRQVDIYTRASDVVKLAANEKVDLKQYEPAMRHLLDSYIEARDSQPLVQFHELGVLELLMKHGANGAAEVEKALGGNRSAAAETIENNIRKKIIEEQAVNPKYYEKMSELLDALIEQRRAEVLEYQEYLEQIAALAQQVSQPGGSTTSYPASLNTTAMKALYDNLGKDELLAVRIDTAVRYTKEAHWVGDRMKERKVRRALRKELPDASDDELDDLLALVKHQPDYQ
ncbi:restriction endonuclease subunit R [Chromatiales bacterium (ex Bugula neritina AB1)]|nr:restriction endonuclease subunit R [Chromatiales bacterium (ex Bugula neritina AB1)]